MARFRIRSNRTCAGDEIADKHDLRLQFSGINLSRRGRSPRPTIIFLVLVIFLNLVNQIGVIAEDIRKQFFVRNLVVLLDLEQPIQDMLKGADKGPGRRSQHLPHDERKHVTLVRRKRVRRFVLKVFRDVLVKGVLAIRTGK